MDESKGKRVYGSTSNPIRPRNNEKGDVMRSHFKRIFAVLLFCCLCALPSAASDDTSGSGYHDYQALTQSLKRLQAQYPKLLNLSSIGKSRQGRDIWLLRISGPQGPSSLEKQALLICGNLEGDHVVGSEVVLGIARDWAESYGKDENVTQILDRRTFYLVPRLNPDGAEFFFKSPRTEYPGNLSPRDEDYDWAVDEDGADDLNGDGLITMMRVKDKEGEWVIDEEDPRLMHPKKPESPLESLYALYPEGKDDDGDERYNEDGPGGFNINRNFPHNFGYTPKGVGVYPASESETLALLKFMTDYDSELKTQPHKNICGVLLFSKFDNLAAGFGIECGKPVFPEVPKEESVDSAVRMMMFGREEGPDPARRPAKDPQPKKTHKKDEPLYKEVAEKYREMTGISSAQSGKPFGSLLEYAYFQYGVPAFSANLWSLRSEKAPEAGGEMKSPGKSDAIPGKNPGIQQPGRLRPTARTGGDSEASASGWDGEWLDWIDKQNGGKGFAVWTEYDHPQLGMVEIGGFQPYLRVNPPEDTLEELSRSHAEFALYLASRFAEISMDAPVVTRKSSRLFEVKCMVRNNGAFPYVTAMGERTRRIPPILVRMNFQHDKEMELFGGGRRVDIPNLESKGEKELTWLVISEPGKAVDIVLRARNGGGTISRKAVLR